MKNVWKSKWMIVAALVLVTGLLFATTADVFAKSNKLNEIKASAAAIEQEKQVLMYENYVRSVKTERAEQFVEPMNLVAAPLAQTAVENMPEPEPEPEFIETFVEENYDAPQAEEEDQSPAGDKDASYDEYYTADQLRFLGEIYAGGWRWTWYSQNVLPGGGLSIPGRHVDENGYICDENDRICLASEDLAYGTVVSTPFGKEGCVYDCGCAYGTLDVYVDF